MSFSKTKFLHCHKTVWQKWFFLITRALASSLNGRMKMSQLRAKAPKNEIFAKKKNFAPKPTSHPQCYESNLCKRETDTHRKRGKIVSGGKREICQKIIFWTKKKKRHWDTKIYQVSCKLKRKFFFIFFLMFICTLLTCRPPGYWLLKKMFYFRFEFDTISSYCVFFLFFFPNNFRELFTNFCYFFYNFKWMIICSVPLLNSEIK